MQDIPLSHGIAAWADDPVVNNTVNPWLTPTVPQYGCTGILETADPVVGVGFAMGADVYRQRPNPDGTMSADGYYHPEDGVLLRNSPNAISEPTQEASVNEGRYTMMRDLNPFPGFCEPAGGCNWSPAPSSEVPGQPGPAPCGSSWRGIDTSSNSASATRCMSRRPRRAAESRRIRAGPKHRRAPRAFDRRTARSATGHVLAERQALRRLSNSSDVHPENHRSIRR